MKHFIKHALENNMEEILAKSFLHCHAHNLHSIMLSEAPGKTIRLFIADEDHTLWKNTLYSKDMSIGYHPHHCNITLNCIYGTIINNEIRTGVPDYLLNEFLFKSPIIQGEEGSFELQKFARVTPKESIVLSAGASLSLASEQIHTIEIAKVDRAAWFVFEGKEDKFYRPVCYSPNDLTTFDMSGLYIRPHEEDIRFLLAGVGLL